MVNVFISRELTADSVFLQRLQSAGFEVISKSLVAFKVIRFLYLPQADWVFFYSKQAVHFFFENLQSLQLKWKGKIAAMGEGTAKAVVNKGYLVNFVGNGEPKATAALFLESAAKQKVLFPRASNSQQSIQKLVEDQLEVFDLIVYENQPRTDFELPDCDWLVFTSPMNAQAYFQKYSAKAGQKVLAIGTTTAEALKLLGVLDVIIAKEASELALAQAILDTNL